MKAFYTYDQQVEKLKEKGLVINDEEKAVSFLRLEGYYNIINGYSSEFKSKKGVFNRGTTFEDICNLYAFDKDIRNIIYKYTSSVETHIKALIAHEFSRAHGVDESLYLQPSCFTSNQNSKQKVQDLISACNETIKEALNPKSNKYRKYIDHNKTKHGHVPMWVLIRALSFGTTSIFFKNMIEEEKERIASNYALSSSQLANMLEVVVSYRNIVAHGERTFCARLPKTRLSTSLGIVKKMQIPKNAKGENKYGKSDFLSLLICCKYLLPSDEMNSLIVELKEKIDWLSARLSPSMMGKIKHLMGLWSNGWMNLPRLIIDPPVMLGK